MVFLRNEVSTGSGKAWMSRQFPLRAKIGNFSWLFCLGSKGVSKGL